MTSPRRAHWLDQAILGARPGRTPQADFDAWHRAHAGATRRLKQRGAQLPRHGSPLQTLARLGSDALRNRFVPPALAATLIIGILLLVARSTDREAAAPPKPTAGVPNQAPPGPSESEITNKERMRAEELFLQGDTKGLLALLDTAQPRTVIVIAAYLGQIGDVAVLATLDRYASQWQGPAQDNPFLKAMTEIRLRHEPTGSPPAAAQSPPATDTLLVRGAVPPRRENRRQTCQGVVTNEAGRPLENARIWAQCRTRDRRFDDLTSPILTDSRGRFNLTVPDDKRAAENSVYVLCERSGYALGWVRLGADWRTSDANDYRIVLYQPTLVAGRVIDATGQPIPEALVEATIVTKQNPFSTQEYLYTAANGRADRTDAAGRFALANVPTYGNLILFVSRSGYAPYDSRQREGRLTSIQARPPFVDPEAYNVRAGQQNLLIVLERATAAIEGRIAYEDGTACTEPLTILCVSTIPSPLCYGYADGKWTLWDRLLCGTCSEIQQGRFTVADLCPGSYWVAAADPVSGDIVTNVEHVLADEPPRPNPVVLEIRRSTEVKVQVVDRNTRRAAANVLVLTEGTFPTQRPTDPNGRCTFALIPGRYTFRVYGQVRHATLTTLQVTPGAKGLHVEVPVSAQPVVHGRLVDESGRPVRGSICLFRGQRVATDAQGRFAVPCEQTAQSVGLARDAARTRESVFLWKRTDGAAERRICVEPPALVVGRVLDEYWMPLSNATAIFSFSVWEPGTQTNHRLDQLLCRLPLTDGRFEFEVPTGMPLTVDAEGTRCGGITPITGQAYDLGDTRIRYSPPAPDPQP